MHSRPRQIGKQVEAILQSPSQQRLMEKEAAVRQPTHQTRHEERRSCDMVVSSRSHSSAQPREQSPEDHRAAFTTLHRVIDPDTGKSLAIEKSVGASQASGTGTSLGVSENWSVSSLRIQEKTFFLSFPPASELKHSQER